MKYSDLPTVNAILNGISFVLLIIGYRFIKSGQQQQHKRVMISALICSALFLTSYLTYHYQVGSVPYPYHGWTRPLYFTILIPHVLLAALMTPFILVAVWSAFRENFDRHRRIMRWIWPVWMFVSISGVAVYLMLYQF